MARPRQLVIAFLRFDRKLIIQNDIVRPRNVEVTVNLLLLHQRLNGRDMGSLQRRNLSCHLIPIQFAIVRCVTVGVRLNVTT